MNHLKISKSYVISPGYDISSCGVSFANKAVFWDTYCKYFCEIDIIKNGHPARAIHCKQTVCLFNSLNVRTRKKGFKKRKTKRVDFSSTDSDIFTSPNAGMTDYANKQSSKSQPQRQNVNYTSFCENASQQPPSATIPPPIQFMQDIQQQLSFIQSQVSEIPAIRSILNSMTIKIDQIETDVKSMKSRINTLEVGTQFLSDSVEDVNKLQQSSTKGISELKTQVESMSSANRVMKDEISDLRCRSMRNNLLFHGIQEDPAGGAEHEAEKCKAKILKF